MPQLLFLFIAHHTRIQTSCRFDPLGHLLCMMDLSCDWNRVSTNCWLIFCGKLSEGRCEWPSTTMIYSQLHWNHVTLFWYLIKVTRASIFRINMLLALIISIIILKSNNVFFALTEHHVVIIIWLLELTINRCVICCLFLISDGTLLLILTRFAS